MHPIPLDEQLLDPYGQSGGSDNQHQSLTNEDTHVEY